MKLRHILLSAAMLFSSALAFAQGELSDEFAGEGPGGLWIEAGVSKKVAKGLSVGVEAEMRLNNNFSNVGRFSAAATIKYKVTNWLKIGAGYTWLYSHYGQEIKAHFNEDDRLNGYNVTDPFWANRHRFTGEMTFSAPKLAKCIKISLRERYQFTWREPVSVEKTKYRYRPGGIQYLPGTQPNVFENVSDWGPLKEEPETVADSKLAKDKQYLRSRLKIEFDKKKCAWHPYVSAEIYNDLKYDFRFDKVRVGAGVGYAINSNHELSLGYLFSNEFEYAAPKTKSIGSFQAHIICLGYEFSF